MLPSILEDNLMSEEILVQSAAANNISHVAAGVKRSLQVYNGEEEKKERLRTMIWPGHEGMDVKQCQAKRAGDERSKECGRSKWMKVE